MPRTLLHTPQDFIHTTKIGGYKESEGRKKCLFKGFFENKKGI